MGRYTDNLVTPILDKYDGLEYHQLPEVDAYWFITNSEFLGVELRPWQSVVVKTLYSLWEIYPPTPQELGILEILKVNWNIELPIVENRHIEEMLMVDGRRAGKSSLLSFLATYEVYSLICKYNPQKHYRMLERTEITIMHVAVSGEQASDMFQFTKNNMRRTKFFRPYFDWTKYNESEMRIFTPFDLKENEAIIAENNSRPAGTMKKALLEGSIIVQSVTTRAATKRGKAIKFLMFSEFAHFARPKFDMLLGDDTLSEEAQQTDYAMWKALTPSVKDFGPDGRVLYESTPRERGGQFYALYCMCGGIDQDKPETATRPPNMAMIQLATWECSPYITRESLEIEFQKDPVGAGMEWGARFGNPSGSFIPESVIQSIPQVSMPMSRVLNNLDYRYVISVDPGGQAKKKLADTYVVAWGHYQIGKEEYWIDGFQGWEQKVLKTPNGDIQKILVDSTEVVGFIVDLVNSIGKQYILEIAYDQWNSAESISTLQKYGFPSHETFFTNKYKNEMYGNFLDLAQQGKVKSYGIDINGGVERFKQELKHLQRYISGGIVYYSHPTTGPVLHDDYADAGANLIYRLSLLSYPTKQSREERVKNTLPPAVRTRTITPIKGPSVTFSTGAGYRKGNFGRVISRIKDR